MSDVMDRLKQNGITLSYTPSVAKWVVSQNEDNKYGARAINRIIQRDVETILADYILEHPGELDIKLKCNNNKLLID